MMRNSRVEFTTKLCDRTNLLVKLIENQTTPASIITT